MQGQAASDEGNNVSFSVFKLNRMGRRRPREMTVDAAARRLDILGSGGTSRWSICIDALSRIERSTVHGSFRLKLQVKAPGGKAGLVDVYDVLFDSDESRSVFCQVVHMMNTDIVVLEAGEHVLSARRSSKGLLLSSKSGSTQRRGAVEGGGGVGAPMYQYQVEMKSARSGGILSNAAGRIKICVELDQVNNTISLRTAKAFGNESGRYKVAKTDETHVVCGNWGVEKCDSTSRRLRILRGATTVQTTWDFVLPSAVVRERFADRVIAMCRAVARKERGASQVASAEQGVGSGGVGAEENADEPLRILATTWNAGSSGPPDTETMEVWLPVPHGGKDRPAHDVYALALQECSSKSEWTTAITRHLNSAVPDSYELLSTVSLWEIHLVVFVRSRIHCKFLHVRTDTEATGIGHVLGNKGGAGISFEFEQTRFCIVSSHLAAHTEGFNTRNKNYMEICENLKGLSSSQGQGREFLHRFDHVFWLGDLNYRVDFGEGTHDTQAEYDKVLGQVRAIAAGFSSSADKCGVNDFESLLCHDQLRACRARDRVFYGFFEAPITFPPTYRTLKGAPGYSNKKCQSPSWCDRILYHSAPGRVKNVRALEYDGLHSCIQSDHRPVRGIFEVDVLWGDDERSVDNSSIAPPSVCVSSLKCVIRSHKAPAGGNRTAASEMADKVDLQANRAGSTEATPSGRVVSLNARRAVSTNSSFFVKKKERRSFLQASFYGFSLPKSIQTDAVPSVSIPVADSTLGNTLEAVERDIILLNDETTALDYYTSDEMRSQIRETPTPVRPFAETKEDSAAPAAVLTVPSMYGEKPAPMQDEVAAGGFMEAAAAAAAAVPDCMKGTWDHDAIPILVPQHGSSASLRRQHLCIVVRRRWDGELRWHKVGQAVLPLEAAFDNGAETTQVRVPMVLRGVLVGHCRVELGIHFAGAPIVCPVKTSQAWTRQESTRIIRSSRSLGAAEGGEDDSSEISEDELSLSLSENDNHSDDVGGDDDSGDDGGGHDSNQVEGKEDPNADNAKGEQGVRKASKGRSKFKRWKRTISRQSTIDIADDGPGGMDTKGTLASHLEEDGGDGDEEEDVGGLLTDGSTASDEVVEYGGEGGIMKGAADSVAARGQRKPMHRIPSRPPPVPKTEGVPKVSKGSRLQRIPSRPPPTPKD